MADDNKTNPNSKSKQPAKKKFDDNDGPGNILAGVQKDASDQKGGGKERRDS